MRYGVHAFCALKKVLARSLCASYEIFIEQHYTNKQPIEAILICDREKPLPPYAAKATFDENEYNAA